jgi:Leucine-rich repeat (LRR) protein
MDKLVHYEISEGVRAIPEILAHMKSLKSLIIPRSVDLNKRTIVEVFNRLETLKLHYSAKLTLRLEFKNLQMLNISSKYEKLPFDAGGMPNITKLTAENINITNIGSKLAYLELKNSSAESENILNELKTYIEIGNSTYNCDIYTIKTIEILQLSSKISNLMPNFTNLRFLVVTSCEQREIPAFVYELPHIDSVAFENCEINTLFDNVTKPSTIKHIMVTNSFVCKIHQNVVFLDNLESLNLSKNLLFSVSPEIFKLPCLEELILSDNFIETLPVEIIDSSSLRTFNIKNNKITKLPYKIHHFMSKLKFISDDIEPNPMFNSYKDKILSITKNSLDPFRFDSVEYPNFVIDKICELLEHIEPFELPDYLNDPIYTDDTKKKISNFIKNDNMIILGKINFLMVFIALNNLMNKSGEMFMQKTKNRINSSKISDPYMLIL